MWADDWFGAASVNTTTKVLDAGRWAYSPVRTDAAAPERNGYGRVTDRTNADPARYVTRGAGSVCGLRTRATLPGCSSLRAALVADDLEQLDVEVEFDFHGHIHMLLGGAWDCGHALTYDKLQKDLDLPTLGGFVEYVAMNLNVLWRYFFFAGYLEFPDGCSYPESFDKCRGACPLLDYRLRELTDEQVYDVVDTGSILSALSSEMLSRDAATGRYVVDGLDYNQVLLLLIFPTTTYKNNSEHDSYILNPRYY